MITTSKLPGFESLKEVKRFQDVFILGFKVFKGDSSISASELITRFKNFLRNSGLEKEMRETAGINVLEIISIIEIVINSLKS